MTWAMSGITGAGAGQYSVVPTTPPGLLLPGESAIVSVTAAALPSPVSSADPEAFAAAVTITTDVPLDPPHVVSLAEPPLGDQLSFAAPSLRFGQTPLNTSLSQVVAVSNQANTGSPPATFTVTPQGAGSSAYSVTPSTASNLAAGATSPLMNVVFTPSSAIPYPPRSRSRPPTLSARPSRPRFHSRGPGRKER